MTKKHLVVISIVGLTPNMLGANTPNLNRLVASSHVSPMTDIFPAVTTTAQSCMLTGTYPNEHGIVANGWYFKELAEVMLWKQSNQLMEGKKVYEILQEADHQFSSSKLFWWYNMYAKVSASLTPRPHYLADGNKIFDLYSSPKNLHQQIENDIGKFPFFTFWGPNSGIQSSEWIAKAAIREFEINRPNLQLVYLPHLDYNLQRLGPSDPAIAEDIKAIDQVAGELIDAVKSMGAEVIVVSEYGITDADHPIHINRILREQGYIQVRETGHFENLDCGASQAFAVADHQCAHIYINEPSQKGKIKNLLSNTPGIERVLDSEEQAAWKINHRRSGDLIAIAEKSAWFTYYFWLDDARAPDYARTVDIHRKPGYDPVELFFNPDIKFPKGYIGKKVLRKLLGFRTLMDFIPLDPGLVKGSHGRLIDDLLDGPILITPTALRMDNPSLTDVKDIIVNFFS